MNTEWCEGKEYADEQFRILLQGDSEMLGNVNHMVLLIENLVNNALFYAQQKASSQRHNRVAIRLAQSKGEVRLGVYNRGPHIDDDEKEKIYQLGFSSRRVREHHGKGLGLYFVHQIAHGFEGSIGFDNICNRADRISLSVKLSNGELLQHQIGIVDIDGKPMCELVESEAYATAGRIAEGAPLAARWHKRFAKRLSDPAPLSREEIDEGYACYGTEDFRIGYRSFLEKKKPEFVGR